MLDPVIKWSGSKRTQASAIVERFPSKIKTYYEPFCGGCSVLFRLLDTPSIRVDHYVCSDINSDLINLWNVIKDRPEDTADFYADLWFWFTRDSDISRRKEDFNSIRTRYNQEHNPMDFLFLSRTSFNGLVRYSSSGKYNSPLHLSRDGIAPKKLRALLIEWSWVLRDHDVQFLCQDYSNIQSEDGDVVYLDPPYASISGMYYGHIDMPKFYAWIREQRGKYFLSFDGKAGEVDNTVEVPKDLYSEHIYLDSGKSSFRRLVDSSKDVKVAESLYIK